MIEELFPPEVRVVRADAEMASEPLHPQEVSDTARMAPKRLAEFRLGRACARRALAALGYPDFALRNDEARVPIWPSGVVGSLTHCEGFCAVAVGPHSQLLGVGIDAEPRRRLKTRILHRITSDAERQHLASLPPAPGESDWGLLLFSAKESFYKCYFPLARRFLGFRDAEIEFLPEEGRFHARLVAHDAPSAAGRRSASGRFGIDANHVATGVALPAR
ncbi:MAG: 4'-phosphopantetheinyl transferase superfamily protein [Myxococcales bacterium]|nr:4'-phosphopantetheinyl transferase superfamily protein [Myxococcales bacterium]